MDVGFVVNPRVARHSRRGVGVTRETLRHISPRLVITPALTDGSIVCVPRNRPVQPPRFEIRRHIFAVVYQTSPISHPQQESLRYYYFSNLKMTR